MDGAVDRWLGIRYKNGHFMMGDKILKIYGDNIMLDDEVYVGTSGLWTLITDKSPKTYTKEDYERYKELLHESNVMYRDYDPKSSYPRANRSTKWNEVLRPIWEESQQKGIVRSDDDDKYFSADGLYLQKNGHCFNIRRICTGRMLAVVYGNGLYIRRGSSMMEKDCCLDHQIRSRRYLY